eukprot:3941280-Rhodomonas_salina.4
MDEGSLISGMQYTAKSTALLTQAAVPDPSSSVAMRFLPRNPREETAISAQIVPGMRIPVLDFGV